MTDKTIYQNAPEYCHYYFDLVETDDLIAELEKSYYETLKLLSVITPHNENYSYQADKWSIKEVVRHIIDCERVFAYRAFRFSRFDETPLSGFDENKYINSLKGVDINLTGLKDEFEDVRKSTLTMFKAMTNDMLDFKGRANNVYFTTRSLGFMIVGHTIHHTNFLQKNYLKC
ncbi:MAG: DinB family protein [Flectobacillus sp.]|uniref:DinB family protein n=1 Tax=Flectobacillus sp. TaxID=50419 RepID=UPI003B9A8547